MQRYNDKFLRQLGELAPQAPDTPDLTTERLHGMVMDRFTVTNQKKNPKKGFRALLVAAIISVSLLTIAATYYSVSDAFRGVFKEQTPTGEKIPISSMSKIVDKSGKLVNASATSEGVRVSVRAITGQANGLNIILDITGPEGKPLAIKQSDGTLSSGEIKFGYVKMRTEDTLSSDEEYEYVQQDIWLGQKSSSFTSAVLPDGDPFDNRATILLSLSLDAQTKLTGKTLYLTLQNLLQESVLAGTDVGMEAGALTRLLSKFEAPSESAYEETASWEDHKTGERILHYTLTEDTSTQLPLAKGLPGYLVTNAAIRDGVFYLRGTAPIPVDNSEILSHAALLNTKTGELKLPYVIAIDTDRDKPDIVKWHITFGDVSSPEALSDYVLVLDAEKGLHPLLKGKWDFTIPLDFENTTRTLDLDQAFTVEGNAMRAKKLTVSPYSISLLTSASESVFRNRLLPANREDNPSATITMQDGTQIQVLGDGRSGTADNCEILFSLDVVIDPSQVKSFAFGDMTINMQKQ